MLNVLKIGLLITTSMMVEPAALDPDIGFPYDCNLVGLSDSSRNEILPAKFSRIDYLGHGLFLGWGINPRDKFQYGDDRYLFNRAGKLLTVKVPERANFVNVCWLGRAAEQDPTLELDALPKDTLLRFSKERLFGLCRLNGEEVLPAKYGFIGKAYSGKAFVSDNGTYATENKTKNSYLFDCSRSVLRKLPIENVMAAETIFFNEGLAGFTNHGQFANKTGYINEDGHFVIEGNFSTVGPFRNGMAAVTLAAQPPGVRSKVIIDKSGKIISPAKLDVLDFYGDFAVARIAEDMPPKYGIVGRQFNFTVQPKYESLTPQMRLDQSELKSPVTRFEKLAIFYVARESYSQPEKLISPTGAEVLVLPPHLTFGYLLNNGLIRCWRPTNNRLPGEAVFIDMKGNEVPDPGVITTKDTHGHSIWYQPIDELVSLKRVSLDNGHFDPDYWKSEHLSNKESAFARFLNEYNLIGMSKDELVHLLGPGSQRTKSDDSFWYTLSPSCTGATELVVKTKHGKVESWSFVESNPISNNSTKQHRLVTTDVVLDLDTGETKPKPLP